MSSVAICAFVAIYMFEGPVCSIYEHWRHSISSSFFKNVVFQEQKFTEILYSADLIYSTDSNIFQYFGGWRASLVFHTFFQNLDLLCNKIHILSIHTNTVSLLVLRFRWLLLHPVTKSVIPEIILCIIGRIILGRHGYISCSYRCVEACKSEVEMFLSSLQYCITLIAIAIY